MARPRLSLVPTLCGSRALALAGLLAWTGDAASTYVSAQIATKVNFQRDIQPLLEAHCIECHGPDEQTR